MAGRFGRWRALAVATTCGLASCGPDSGQIALCERVVREMVGPPETIEIVDWRDDDDGPYTLAAVYRRRSANRDETLTCAFSGGGLGEERLELAWVRLDDGRKVAPVPFAYLKRRLGLP